MLKELLGVYEAGLINPGKPECLFPETDIFNEGWLLRLVLSEWLTGSGGSGFEFLPFPEGGRAYSEGQLYTPFKARFRADKLAESNTRVDGIVGDFTIKDTKSGIVLDSDMSYVAVFEAKLFAPIAPGVTNAPRYDQVSRTAGCLINSILDAKPAGDYDAYLTVLHVDDKHRIDPDLYTPDHVEKQIARRVRSFLKTGNPGSAVEQFARVWRDVLDHLQIHFHTWEEVLSDMGNEDLDDFYEKCKTFNK